METWTIIKGWPDYEISDQRRVRKRSSGEILKQWNGSVRLARNRYKRTWRKVSGLMGRGSVKQYIPPTTKDLSEPVKGKFVFPKFLYARTLDNKTIDVSYGPQDMNAIEYIRNDIEYIRNDFVEHEQPEVDLEKEIDNVIADYSFTKTIDSGGFKTTVIDYVKIARHFYELGLNARKEK